MVSCDQLPDKVVLEEVRVLIQHSLHLGQLQAVALSEGKHSLETIQLKFLCSLLEVVLGLSSIVIVLLVVLRVRLHGDCHDAVPAVVAQLVISALRSHLSCIKDLSLKCNSYKHSSKFNSYPNIAPNNSYTPLLHLPSYILHKSEPHTVKKLMS